MKFVSDTWTNVVPYYDNYKISWAFWASQIISSNEVSRDTPIMPSKLLCVLQNRYPIRLTSVSFGFCSVHAARKWTTNPLIVSPSRCLPEMQPVLAAARSGLGFLTGRFRNFFYFFMSFWAVFAKVTSENTLFCMSKKFYWYHWQSLQRKM